MPSQLTPFFTFPLLDVQHHHKLQVKFVLNVNAITAIEPLCSTVDSDFNLSRIGLVKFKPIDDYFGNWFAASTDRLTTVAQALYIGFMAEPTLPNIQICWYNFFHYTGARVIKKVWYQLPEHQQKEDILNRLVNRAEQIEKKYPSQQILKNFDSSYHLDLLSGIQGWTYTWVRNNLSSYLRDSNTIPFYGISDLAVVNASSIILIRTILGSSNLSSGINDVLLCKIFKQFLSRQSMPVAQLNHENSDDHWKLIIQEYQTQINHQLPLTAAQVRQRVEKIGGIIRQYEYSHHPEFSVISYRSILESDEHLEPIDRLENNALDQPVNDIERSEWLKAHHQLCDLVDEEIAKLTELDRQIFNYRYINNLTQTKIANLVDRDQTVVSKRFKKINLNLLKSIHQQLSSATELTPEINPQAIAAITTFLKKYFDRGSP